VFLFCSFTMGSYWPHGTVNVTFLHGTRAGLITKSASQPGVISAWLTAGPRELTPRSHTYCSAKQHMLVLRSESEFTSSTTVDLHFIERTRGMEQSADWYVQNFCLGKWNIYFRIGKLAFSFEGEEVVVYLQN
jgi:hypothetical protein